MKILNKKAMTLFELLAVIIILGVIAAIAFPTVNRLIDNQRRSAFAEEANLFIQSAVQLAEDEYEFYEDTQFTYYLNFKDDSDYDEEFDITEEFTKLSGDYKGKITFEVVDDELTITEIIFENNKYKIDTEKTLELTIRFDRADVAEK